MKQEKATPAGRLEKLKALSLKSLKKAAEVAKGGLPALLVAAMLSYCILSLPALHTKLLRAYAGAHVYKIMLDSKVDAGGTGFAIKGKSGTNYVVTNSHVCDGLEEIRSNPVFANSPTKSGELLVVAEDGTAIKRRILSVSDKSDLCLLEGLPNDNGLSLGSGDAKIGDVLTSLGHPYMLPLTQSTGEVTNIRDIEIPAYAMPTGDKDLDKWVGAKDNKCDQPKNKIDEQETVSLTETGFTITKIKICMNVTKDTYQTNMVGYPGNSGSPVVDKWGRVVGVFFAGDGRTNWGFIVNYSDLTDFLSAF